MKIAVVSLIISCVCAGCWKGESSGLEDVNRQTRIGQIMKQYYHGRCEFEASGPLTFAQVENRLREGYERRRTITSRVGNPVEPFEDSGPGKALARFKDLYRDGDGLYFFTSDKQSWNNLAGIRGFVLIRENRIVDVMATGWN